MALESQESLPVKPLRFSPDDALPPVEPPNMGFLLQLFLIPLLIVSAIVGVWFLFSWLASSTTSPQEMLQEIRLNRASSWQRAVTLASLLDNPDSRYAELRRDPAFAKQLGDLLREERKLPLDDREQHEQRLKVCYYLCRALGCLETTEALPPLLEAAASDRNVAEVDIRLGALESLSLLAKRLGPQVVREYENVIPVLIACSRASDQDFTPQKDQSPDYRPQGEVRGAAAFALGIVGGDAAQERLVGMLSDPYPNARYNAAMGLARLGDERAIPLLVEMLDPKNELGARDESFASDRDNKRVTVLNNAMEGALQLAPHLSPEAQQPLKNALEKIAAGQATNVKDASARRALQLHARETMERIEATDAR